MTETQQRFLKAIAERIETGRVAELRLYPTVRAGQVETGVAIVAVESGGAAVEAGEGNAVPTDPVAVSDLTRLAILTARFRLTVKGPDRGKWEFAVVHDADAPIETVESVVRGVARRAGEDGEPELLSGAEFLRALAEPWWTATA